MKCNEIRNFVLPYLDSELDARTSQEIHLHLQSCAECAEIFAREEKFNERLFGALRVGQPTPALWEQIEARLRPQRRTAWLSSPHHRFDSILAGTIAISDAAGGHGFPKACV